MKKILLQEAALQGLCAPLRGGLCLRSGQHGASLAFLGHGAAARPVSLRVGGATVTSLVPSKLVKKMLWPAGSCPGAAYGAAEAVDGPNGFLWTCSSPLGSADCAVFALTAEKTSSGACMCGEVMMVLQPGACCPAPTCRWWRGLGGDGAEGAFLATLQPSQLSMPCCALASRRCIWALSSMPLFYHYMCCCASHAPVFGCAEALGATHSEWSPLIR